MTVDAFPLQSDHIVSSKLCDPKVKQYSGYLNIAPNANMFFWFFESRKNPKNSPLTIWLSGGPGYSSMFALFQEVGPCKIDKYINKSRLSVNSWNKVTNLLFIDQPIGAGFSYGARMILYKVPKYASLDLHLFSESYGGHYVPVMAKLIIQNNGIIKTGKLKDLIPINLKSCGIGDKPLLSPQLIEEMRDKWPLCKHDIEECYKTDTIHDCVVANITCLDDYSGIYAQNSNNSNASLYDIRTINGRPDAIYAKFLDDPFVMKSIGVNTNEITSYLEINNDIYNRFTDSGDLMHSMMSQVEFLLHNNIPILFFTGDADYICNWMGGNEMAESLKWKRQHEFKNAVFREWNVGEVKADEIRKLSDFYEDPEEPIIVGHDGGGIVESIGQFNQEIS
ncbi:Alpha/Beta hydrolase protein [Gigaspora rosea]|uniref:Carboxypeptidase n=1 Tax=Gigaspora rosea TaxID=44941 RepID=A0A397TYY5_9GLOM|nr:Alpha/Beta hydrolase protein [Gigaspora rosea]